MTSGNGAHLYWLLDEPYLIDDAGDLLPVETEWTQSADGRKKPRRFIVEDGDRVYLDQRRHISQISPKARHIQDLLAGVAQSALPPGYYAGDYHFGLTTPSLDLYLRDHIPNWRGRGPCIVINDLGFADDFDPVDLDYVVPTSALHELAHILDRPALFADRTGADPNKLLFESLVIANSTKRPPRDDLPAYFGHEAGFIRISLHLCHRAERAGVTLAPAAICAGHRYGLSHASDYQDALGDEPACCADMLFCDIAETDPPPAFSQLWAQDFVSYHDRFPHCKGVSL